MIHSKMNVSTMSNTVLDQFKGRVEPPTVKNI